jgi:hypothetical protein
MLPSRDGARLATRFKLGEMALYIVPLARLHASLGYDLLLQNAVM